MLDVTPRPPRLQGDAEVNSNGGRGRAADGVLWVDCLQPEHNFTLTNLRCPCFNTVASITASPPPPDLRVGLVRAYDTPILPTRMHEFWITGATSAF
jgi:hypothetical protein